MKKVLLLLTSLSFAVVVGAHDDSNKSAGPNLDPVQTAFGSTGDPKTIQRTINVDMSDTMRFAPGAIEVRQGETIRFSVRNRGKVLHEFVLGTDQELAAHAQMMKKHPTMEHDAPYMAHVAAAKRGEIIWRFTEPGEFKFACLIPGHFEAGMVGTIRVVAQ